MQPFEEIKAYCHSVSQQIRWKKAKPAIVTEIKTHLCDQRDAYMAEGDDEASATQKAITQMGDAVSVGQTLDQIHKPKPQWIMILLTGFFMLMGLFINYYINTSLDSLNTFSVFPFVLAFGILLCCYYMDFTLLGKHAGKVYALVLIVSVLGIAFGTRFNGVSKWVAGGFSLSLSYLSLLFPLAFALLVYSVRKEGIWGVLLCGMGYFPLAVILLYIPTMSGLLLFTIAAFCILCFAICRGWFGENKKKGLLLALLPITFVAACLLVGMLLNMSNYAQRLFIFLNPSQERMGAGFLYSFARETIEKSVFFGQGGIPEDLGGISTLLNFGPDFGLLYLIHRFGFIALLCIALPFVVFSAIGIHKVRKEKSTLGSLVTFAIILTFILQTALYVVNNLGYGLLSSLSLPFVTYGNTALFINAALVGFMLSVFRTGETFKDSSLRKHKHGVQGKASRISYADGKLTIDLQNRNF